MLHVVTSYFFFFIRRLYGWATKTDFLNTLSKFYNDNSVWLLDQCTTAEGRWVKSTSAAMNEVRRQLGPSSKPSVAVVQTDGLLDRLLDKLSQTWNSRRSACHLFRSLTTTRGTVGSKIDHRSLSAMPLFGATSAALKCPKNNHNRGDKVSATAQEVWPQNSIHRHV